MSHSPPNVLILMSDEHRPDVAGFAGDPVIRTPTLDRLAQTGVTFNNAYTPAPVCIPARQCMMAGQLPMTCGCRSFADDLPPFSMTFARRFAEAGYHTLCCGKLHHRGMDPMQGWLSRPSGDLHIADLHLPDRDEHAHRANVDNTPPGVGKWSAAKEVRRAGVGVGPYADEDRRATETLGDELRRYFCDPYYDRPQGHRPLMVKLSLHQPHYPYLTDEDRFNYYLNRVTPWLESAPDHPGLAIPHFRITPGEDATERDIRRATCAYYGMIESIDAMYQRTLDTLEHVGQSLDDWLIIYTTDHGEMLGQHGVWEKKAFYEASARVPLIVRPPKTLRDQWQCEGSRVEENVNLCDLFATLCDIAGVEPPPTERTVHGAGLDSRSLVPLMRGETRAWHDQHHNETISFAWSSLMIKRDALKYQWYGRDGCEGREEVLFDLEADPGETLNIIDAPAYADAAAMFRQRRAELGIGPDAHGDYRNAGYG